MRKVLSLFVFCCMVATPPILRSQDVAGSEDHPLITRFPGSKITWYDNQGFAPYRIAVGPVTGYRKIDQWRDLEGGITRISYTVDGERNFYEVYSNYLNAVKKAGFEVLAEGFQQTRGHGEIGSRSFLEVHYKANELPPGASLLLTGSSTSGGSGFIAGYLERPQGNVAVAVGVAQYKSDQVVVLVDVIAEQAMEDDLIRIDADAMSRDIDSYGKVALYGIYFDHNSAKIKPESLPALQEIASLMKKRATLNVYVVGHTDAKGTLEYNLQLSKSRAESVAGALVKDFGIAASRLQPQGVGPLVPVASNQADSGRAKNRRVELVER